MKDCIPTEYSISEVLKKKLRHHKLRLEQTKDEQERAGGPTKHTYHGGWSAGYYEGKVAAIEDILDYLGENYE